MLASAVVGANELCDVTYAVAK